MEHSLHVGTCSTRTYVHREVACFFPFIYSLARRKVLQDKRVPGEQFCKWRYRIVCLFLLQNWKAKIWNSDTPRCTVHQRVKNRHVFITRQSLPPSLLCPSFLQQPDCELSEPRCCLNRGGFPPSCRDSGTHSTNLRKMITQSGGGEDIRSLFTGRRRKICFKKRIERKTLGGCCLFLCSSIPGFTAVAKHCI